RQSDTEVPRPGGRSSLKSRYGRLTIITTPPNAKIFIDGKPVKEVTPATLERFEVGRREVRLELDKLLYVDTVLILPDTTITIQLSRDDLMAADRARRANLRVPINIVIEFPGCIYRWEKKDTKRPEIDGVDPIIEIDGAIGGRVVLNHESLPSTNKKYDRDLRLEHKEMPDTSYVLTLKAGLEQKLKFKVDLTLDQRSWFLKRTRPHSVHKKYSVPADFNAGRVVNVRITILGDGEVLFRYF
ncbi:MAG TPA: PEGA domain-containing protein, partial [Planctomycetaceae bacterium]|nr:PEGA domain-containing protein [Planctomycetaceae bacterium]